MNHYADSSFLVSCYITDTNTSQAKAWLLGTGDPLIFTALHVLEVKNALMLGVFRGLFTATNAGAAWANVEMDRRSGRLVKKPVNWPLVIRIAQRLIERYSAAVGTRSLDILHVAAAKALRAVEFVSFDQRQRTLAASVGLTVKP